MRSSLLALALTGFAIATPAAAQYYPYPGSAYGHRPYSGWHEARGLAQRIHNVLASLDGVRPDQRHEVHAHAIELDRGLRRAARNGLSPREHHQFDQWIGDLERHMLATSGNRRQWRRGW